MREAYQHVSRRSEYQCNFLEVELEAAKSAWDSDVKLIYRYEVKNQIVVFLKRSKCFCCRHYATLYFVFVVDSSESELGILDLIQVQYFLSYFDLFSNSFQGVCGNSR